MGNANFERLEVLELQDKQFVECEGTADQFNQFTEGATPK